MTAPIPQCAALAAAKERTGLSYSEIATKANTTEQRIIDICTCQVTPTQPEFQAIAAILGITDKVPKDDSHKTV